MIESRSHVGIRSLRPALLWALAHGLLLLWFYGPALRRAVATAPQGLGWALHAGFAVQALSIGLVLFLTTLPLLVFGRRYPHAAVLWIALASAGFFLDALVFESFGFHINGLVISVALQPNGLAETGLSRGEVAALGGGMAAALVADLLLGVALLRRFPSSRPVWPWVLGALLLWTGERVSSASLIFLGGQPAEQATTLLPLQPRLRMNKQLEALTGRKAVRELRLGEAPQVGMPVGDVRPSNVRLTRRPDILFVLIESLRADFLTDAIMPNLSERSRSGTIFPRHYSAAASTQFSLFSLLYGLDAQRRDSLIGAGRTPLLFPALKQNGYELRFLSASSVEWMDLKETVFRDVVDGLETEFEGDFNQRDEEMMRRAAAVLRDAPKDRPLFLFVFFSGTHFPYEYPPRSAVFSPAWDGRGALGAARKEPTLILNRARNSAVEVDRKLEGLFQTFEAARDGEPLVLVTGDHGEELNERGFVGHSSDVSAAQLHVPMVIWDEALAPGTYEAPTGHVDVVPTLLSLLGDGNDARGYSDGAPMHLASDRRFVLSTVGWEPRFALIGKDLKVTFRGTGGGLGSVRITDPADGPLEDGEERFASRAASLLRRLRGHDEPPREEAVATD